MEAQDRLILKPQDTRDLTVGHHFSLRLSSPGKSALYSTIHEHEDIRHRKTGTETCLILSIFPNEFNL